MDRRKTIQRLVVLLMASSTILAAGLFSQVGASEETPVFVRDDGTINLALIPDFIPAVGKHGIKVGFVYKADLYEPARGVDEPPVYSIPSLDAPVVGKLTADGFVTTP